TQLAVLAAAPVVAGGGTFGAVQGILAGHAQAHAGQRLAARGRDRLVAFLAVARARPARELAARTLDRVVDGRVDLVLHRVVACPARCHGTMVTNGGKPRLNRPAGACHRREALAPWPRTRCPSRPRAAA